MTLNRQPVPITVGVLALQGAFREHLDLLRDATTALAAKNKTIATQWNFVQVRTPDQLAACHALILPGGESTTMALVAARSGMLEPLRDFVKVHQKPTWGTCAGLILLAESANRTKKGGQDLIGGLDVRVNRNHFGRQIESFQADLDLPFLKDVGATEKLTPFHGIFIRAPVVEKILPSREDSNDEIVMAPFRPSSKNIQNHTSQVEIMARLPDGIKDSETVGDIVAVRQGNAFGTSFHPELTRDPRIHMWWLEQVQRIVDQELHLNNE